MTGASPTPDPGMTGTSPTPDPGMTGTSPTPDPGMTGTSPTPDPGMMGTSPTPDPGMTGTSPTPDPGMTGTSPTPDPGMTGTTVQMHLLQERVLLKVWRAALPPEFNLQRTRKTCKSKAPLGRKATTAGIRRVQELRPPPEGQRSQCLRASHGRHPLQRCG
jgi:hypothetical protein